MAAQSYPYPPLVASETDKLFDRIALELANDQQAQMELAGMTADVLSQAGQSDPLGKAAKAVGIQEATELDAATKLIDEAARDSAPARQREALSAASAADDPANFWKKRIPALKKGSSGKDKAAQFAIQLSLGG